MLRPPSAPWRRRRSGAWRSRCCATWRGFGWWPTRPGPRAPTVAQRPGKPSARRGPEMPLARDTRRAALSFLVFLPHVLVFFLRAAARRGRSSPSSRCRRQVGGSSRGHSQRRAERLRPRRAVAGRQAAEPWLKSMRLGRHRFLLCRLGRATCCWMLGFWLVLGVL